MDRTQFEKPPRWWAPKLSPTWVRLLKPFRSHLIHRVQKLRGIDVVGIEHLKAAVDAGKGVLVTPNHSGHADALVMYAAAERLGRPFYFMTAWQVLGLCNPVRRWVFRKHGCFSVDREGADMQAFKQAVDVLGNKPNPLVIFPEGEVYHTNERVTPFREGPAAIALSTAKRADRPIVCVPCGIRYAYVDDPTPELLPLMDELERRILWRPTPERPFADRIYRLATALLALKELEYLHETRTGTVSERVRFLNSTILERLEERYGVEPGDAIVPERVKKLRQHAIAKLDELPIDDTQRPRYIDDMEDLFFVVQSFSYPGDYVAERPSIERIAETLDKFEEDVLQRQTATIRGARRATVAFGEPIEVDPAGRKRGGAEDLTHRLEEQVQSLINASVAQESK